jgi:hypothetical protein
LTTILVSPRGSKTLTIFTIGHSTHPSKVPRNAGGERHSATGGCPHDPQVAPESAIGQDQLAVSLEHTESNTPLPDWRTPARPQGLDQYRLEERELCGYADYMQTMLWHGRLQA